MEVSRLILSDPSAHLAASPSDLMYAIFTSSSIGSLCVPSDEDRSGGTEDFANRTGVNTLMLTPSHAKLLGPAAMPDLKSLITRK